jgi:hypothetical protein
VSGHLTEDHVEVLEIELGDAPRTRDEVND